MKFNKKELEYISDILFEDNQTYGEYYEEEDNICYKNILDKIKQLLDNDNYQITIGDIIDYEEGGYRYYISIQDTSYRENCHDIVLEECDIDFILPNEMTFKDICVEFGAKIFPIPNNENVYDLLFNDVKKAELCRDRFIELLN